MLLSSAVKPNAMLVEELVTKLAAGICTKFCSTRNQPKPVKVTCQRLAECSDRTGHHALGFLEFVCKAKSLIFSFIFLPCSTAGPRFARVHETPLVGP